MGRVNFYSGYLGLCRKNISYRGADMKYRFADLFCGCGGMSLGLINAGFKDVVAVDFWETAKVNYLSYPLLSKTCFCQTDMFNKNERDELLLLLKKKKIDILAGGPPCQGFSTLGKRKELDNRNTLVEAYLEMVLKVRPKMFIMENVPAIQSMKHISGKKYPEYARELLEANRFYVAKIIVEGFQVGLGQRRKRMFLVGINKEYVRPIKNFEEILDITLKDMQPSDKYLSLREIIGDLPSLQSGEGEEEIIVNDKKIYNHNVFKYEEQTLKRIKAVPKNGGLQDIPDDLLSNHLIKMKKGLYGSGGFVKNLYGRLDWNSASGTIVAGIKKITCGRFFHPTDDRLLTVREAARLQSFPDDYKFYGSMIDQYTVVGNAVPPKFSQYVGSVLVKIFEKYEKDDIDENKIYCLETSNC